ncbi:MAG TPA: hypothetical protein VFU47_11225, partial [Armatimonadota bacterium]|nr:hypothetical protein [Armatimonadota bacterium]
MSRPDPGERDLRTVLPVYAASLVVTLAAVGAVGMTLTGSSWTPIWAVLTVLGHAVSLQLRRMRVNAEAVFYPVMLLGSAFALQQALVGSPLVGMEAPLGNLPMDMSTAVVIAILAVVRTFTLVTDSTLLFSPVPAITMLALVASSNPNAEVPVFFGLFLLGSLFITGYEAHLRRSARSGRPARAPLLHLLSAWSITLLVMGVALLF